MSNDDPQPWGDVGRDVYRELLERRGLDPDTEPSAAPGVDPFWEQAQANLAATIPARFAAACPDTPRVAQWVTRFNHDPRSCPSMLLTGMPGTGKTWQLLGALRAVVEHAAARHRTVPYRMVTHPRLNDLVRVKQDDSHQEALEPFESASLLLLDDLGAGKQTDWNGDCLYRLVDHRWFHSLPTIYATNLSLSALTVAIGERVVSRVVDGYVVPFEGPDRRRGGVR